MLPFSLRIGWSLMLPFYLPDKVVIDVTLLPLDRVVIDVTLLPPDRVVDDVTQNIIL